MNDDALMKWVMFVASLVVIGALGVAGASILSDGRVSHCYVEVDRMPDMGQQFRVYGFRPWRTDRHLGTFATITNAGEAAKAYGCELK